MLYPKGGQAFFFILMRNPFSEIQKLFNFPTISQFLIFNLIPFLPTMCIQELHPNFKPFRILLFYPHQGSKCTDTSVVNLGEWDMRCVCVSSLSHFFDVLLATTAGWIFRCTLPFFCPSSFRRFCAVPSFIPPQARWTARQRSTSQTDCDQTHSHTVSVVWERNTIESRNLFHLSCSHWLASFLKKSM